MSYTISSLLQPALPAAPGGAVEPQQNAPRPSADLPPAREAVTLSSAAQASAQLLASAREAEGIDQDTVKRIRAAIESGNYNVAPEDPVQAIITVLKDST
jgi:flagellar biosynthesis anti-sigma factor FlgM